VLRAVVSGGLAIAVLGLFALGLATIIRHTAGAITAFVGTFLVLPLLVEALPSSIGAPIAKFLPLHIIDTMTSVKVAVDQSQALSPWLGFGFLCAYAVGALAVGGILMVRRDA
jgi:hypothetical protein